MKGSLVGPVPYVQHELVLLGGPKGQRNRHWAPKTRIVPLWFEATSKTTKVFGPHSPPGVARIENSSSSRVRAELRERFWDPGRHFPSAVLVGPRYDATALTMALPSREDGTRSAELLVDHLLSLERNPRLARQPLKLEPLTIILNGNRDISLPVSNPH